MLIAKPRCWVYGHSNSINIAVCLQFSTIKFGGETLSIPNTNTCSSPRVPDLSIVTQQIVQGRDLGDIINFASPPLEPNSSFLILQPSTMSPSLHPDCQPPSPLSRNNSVSLRVFFRILTPCPLPYSSQNDLPKLPI